MSDFTILTVCSGNICRSPLMELMLRDRLGTSGFAVASAGVIAQPGWRMPDEAQTTAARLGIAAADAAAHRARRLDAASVTGADLVLTATREHRTAVIELVPKATRYAFTLFEFERLVEAFDQRASSAITATEFVERAHGLRTLLRPTAPEHDDLEDPFTQPQQVHDRVGDQIAVMVDTISHRLGSTIPKPAASEVRDVASTPTRPPLDLSFPRRAARGRQQGSPDAPSIG